MGGSTIFMTGRYGVCFFFLLFVGARLNTVMQGVLKMFAFCFYVKIL